MIINKLSEIMGRKRIRICELQRMTGLSRNAITGVYYDKRDGITYDVMDKICNALEISVGELFEHVQK